MNSSRMRQMGKQRERGIHMLDRRDLLKGALLGSAAYWLGSRLFVGGQVVAVEPGALDSAAVSKFVTQMVVPPAMPGKFDSDKDSYKIAVRQFSQQILPAGFGATTVWSYGSVDHPQTFNYPAFTIEAKAGKKVEVEWRNELYTKDASGKKVFLKSIVPVDPTLHWANPPGGTVNRDTRPTFATTPSAYEGPVPIVTHVHGAHTHEESDGYPEAWYLPLADNIPAGYARTGTFFDVYNARHKRDWNKKGGSATFKYPNDQRASTLWYHDHALGMTRTNVYAGPAGFYLVRGGASDKVIDTKTRKTAKLPGPAPKVGDDPLAGTYGEIPIAVQDRAFKDTGALFYPDSRAFFGDVPTTGPFIPGTEISPIWNPEFFGDTIVVNGRTWPFLDVQRKRYRFRFLNGSNSRFLVLKLTTKPREGSSGNPNVPDPGNLVFNKPDPNVKFWQIGNEGGFLAAPAKLDYLLMGNAERADVIIDFSKLPPSTTVTDLYLVNDGPDGPFNGLPAASETGGAVGDYFIADWATTGQVMKFRVEAATVVDKTTPPDKLGLPAVAPIGTTTTTRNLTLNELVTGPNDPPAPGIPIAALLGTVADITQPPLVGGEPNPLFTKPMGWDEEFDPVSENPKVGDVEEWRIWNLTADAHPIHLHLVSFQVVGRERFDQNGIIPGSFKGPETWETGFKDTVISYPDQVLTIRAKFDVGGRFVWHCHIVEHEDNEMMRPYLVGKEPPAPPKPPAHHPHGHVHKHKHPRRRWWKED
jgi:spore coat protein A, manganese oxidase